MCYISLLRHCEYGSIRMYKVSYCLLFSSMFPSYINELVLFPTRGYNEHENLMSTLKCRIKYGALGTRMGPQQSFLVSPSDYCGTVNREFWLQTHLLLSEHTFFYKKYLLHTHTEQRNRTNDSKPRVYVR